MVKVWIVQRDYDYEGLDVRSVWSSEELALDAVERYKAERRKNDMDDGEWIVTEYVLDDPEAGIAEA